MTRYSLLPYLYSLFFLANQDYGTTVRARACAAPRRAMGS